MARTVKALMIAAGVAAALAAAAAAGQGRREAPSPPSAHDPRKTIPAAELREDLAALWSMLEEGHAGLDRYTPADVLKKSFEDAASGLTGPMTVVEFHVEVLRLLARIKDGHTRANLPEAASAYLDSLPVSLPFGLRFLDGKAFILRNLSSTPAIKEGSELLSIDGMSMTDVLSALVPLIPSDAGIRTRPLRMLEFPALFGRLLTLRFGPRESFRVRLRPPGGGAVREVSVPGVAGKDVARILNERYPDSALRPPLYELTFRGDTAVLAIRAFADDDGKKALPYPEFLRAAFRVLEEKGTAGLVIDLRDNGGGRDEYAKLLFAHVMDRPFLYYRALEAKKDHYDLFRYADEPKEVQDEYARQVKRNDRGWFDVVGHPNSGLQQPEEAHFGGRVAILINGMSFSATGETTSLFHFHRKAVFFGEECGAGYYGNTSGFSVMVTLPKSGIRVRIPLVIYVMAVDGYPRDRGLVPDVPVTPTIEDLLSGRDPVMDRAFRYLAEK
jgi:Peptidase family S41